MNAFNFFGTYDDLYRDFTSPDDFLIGYDDDDDDRPRIIELVDTESDARSSELQNFSTSKPIKKFLRYKNVRDNTGQRSRVEGIFNRRNSIQELKKKSKKDFEVFDEFELEKFEDDEYKEGKRFVDRAVDIDSLSAFSTFSLEKNSSSDISIVKLKSEDIKNPKIVTNVLKSSENSDRTRVTSTKEPKKVPEKSNEKNRKLVTQLKPIVKKKNPIVTKVSSETPRSKKSRIDLKKENNEVATKTRLKRSRLPVWQGQRKNLKITSSVVNKVDRVEVEKIIDKDLTTEKKENHLWKPKESQEAFEINALKIEEILLTKNSKLPEDPNITKTSQDTKSDLENKKLSKNENRSKKKEEKEIEEDQSRSTFWSHNYEEAYLKGRAIGLKIFRMAKALRDERKKEFRKYGFEDYLKRTREEPSQELLDIGVSLIENVLDNSTKIINN